MSLLERLPSDLRVLIVSQLPFQAIGRLSATCSMLYQWITGDLLQPSTVVLWKALYRKHLSEKRKPQRDYRQDIRMGAPNIQDAIIHGYEIVVYRKTQFAYDQLYYAVHCGYVDIFEHIFSLTPWHPIEQINIVRKAACKDHREMVRLFYQRGITGEFAPSYETETIKIVLRDHIFAGAIEGSHLELAEEFRATTLSAYDLECPLNRGDLHVLEYVLDLINKGHLEFDVTEHVMAYWFKHACRGGKIELVKRILSLDSSGTIDYYDGIEKAAKYRHPILIRYLVELQAQRDASSTN